MSFSLQSLKWLCLLLISINAPMQAWWNEGHILVALVAEEDLLPQVKEKVDALAQGFKEVYPEHASLCSCSIWPDHLKEKGLHLFDKWHFTNIPFDPEQVITKEQKGEIFASNHQNDIVWLLGQAKKGLKSGKGDSFTDAFLLKFLVHCVGDIHQPMHCCSRYSKNKPHGDQGGNLFKLKGNEHANLHMLWDDGGGAFPKVSFNPNQAEMQQLADFAKKLREQHPKNGFTAAGDSNFKNWAIESAQIAQTEAYSLQEETIPSEADLERVQRLAKQRVALAGYRLANLLNEIFSQPVAEPAATH